MSVSPFDSALYRDLFSDTAVGQLFTDTADVRAMMLVLGGLARVQGKRGDIPEVSGAFLHRAMMELQVDPGGLAHATASDGTPVPGLVAALRKLLQAPEHATFLQWDVPDRDIAQTALILRLRQVLVVLTDRLDAALTALARLAPHDARAATWGEPLLACRDGLADLRAGLLVVTHGGAARDDLAVALGLGAASDGADLSDLAAWLTAISAAAGRIGADLASQTDTPAARVLAALARQARALNTAFQGDDADDLTATLILPQLAMTAARALTLGTDLAIGLPLDAAPDTPDARARAFAARVAAIGG